VRISFESKKRKEEKGLRWGTLALSEEGGKKQIFFPSPLGYCKISENLNRVRNVFFDRKDCIFVL